MNLARDLLEAELPDRWLHVQGVARRAAAFHEAFDHDRLELLIAAGYLHDIGYSAKVKHTGFHPLDGARYLRAAGHDEAIVSLVANHTCAPLEAELHGVRRELEREFPLNPLLPNDALAMCDLTTSPRGESITLDDRFSDIRCRYGPTHKVTTFINQAEPHLRAAVDRAEALLTRSRV